MTQDRPILVTGAGGGIGGVGRTVVGVLRQRDLPVRALVHHDDHRADALRALGAQVIAGDLTHPDDVAAAIDGARRMLFSMSVSPDYLEATATVAAVANATGDLDALVNMSQMTVSQMTATSTEESHQQRLHWLSEQVLNWSGLPVVHLRPTIFLDNPLFTTLAARSIAENSTLRLPFGTGRTSPVAARDVARVAATILQDPAPHLGRIYELTGPRSEDLTGVAVEYSRALHKQVSYVDVPFEQWSAQELMPAGFPEHVHEHIATMTRLHRQNRYDRSTHDIERLTGHPAQTVEDFVAERAELFTE